MSDWAIPRRAPLHGGGIRPKAFCCHCPEMLSEPPVPMPGPNEIPETPECCREPINPQREADYQAWLAEQRRPLLKTPLRYAASWLDEPVEEGKVLA